jgi:hypothetical protein
LKVGRLRTTALVLLGGLCMNVSASDVGSLTTFSANTPARASEVNGNFSAVGIAVNDNFALINSLRSELNNALARIESLENSNVLQLEQFVSVVGGETIVRFEGVNLQVVNGLLDRESVNGLGNIIVGYNETRDDGEDNKTGSHNMVIGGFNNYSSYGGLVAGEFNHVRGPAASVTGGFGNLAGGSYSSVSGGNDNIANGTFSSVNGGASNVVSQAGESAAVAGGKDNIASGFASSVSGGQNNFSEDDFSIAP